MAALKKTFLKFGITTLSVVLFSITSLAQDAQQPRAVIELFTSQGCSSCPPADKVLSYYAQSKDVLALSWHVDYWNYLGWKDTFSKSEFTNRQRLYAASFRRQGIYTPQAVINGRTHIVGSHRAEIEDTITQFNKKGKGLIVPISLSREDGMIRISAKGKNLSGTTAWIVHFDRKRVVEINRGENRGRSITYHNVVQEYSMLGMSGQDGILDLTLPLDVLQRKGSEACAIIVQKTGRGGILGPIVGAGVLYDLQTL